MLTHKRKKQKEIIVNNNGKLFFFSLKRLKTKINIASQINITVRTFSSVEHAELFLNIAKANQIPKELSAYNLSADFKIVQNVN